MLVKTFPAGNTATMEQSNCLEYGHLEHELKNGDNSCKLLKLLAECEDEVLENHLKKPVQNAIYTRNTAQSDLI